MHAQINRGLRNIRTCKEKSVTFYKTTVLSVICTVLSLVVLAKGSEAGTTPMNYTASGSFGSSAFTFPDGNPATSITLTGKSSVGPVNIEEWGAGAFDGKTCTPSGGAPNSGSEVNFKDSLEVITFVNTGEELIQGLVSGTECFSLGPFSGTMTVKNVGGTGRFAGATGTETLNFEGEYLTCGSTGCVGFVQHDETGTVTTP
jgi:hypothetical protein